MDPNAAKTVRIKFPANLRVGYCQIPEAEFDPKVHELWADPLDHDNDGKPGGSVAPEQTDDLADLRAQYAELFGKRPFMGWDATMLTAKIEERLAE